MVSGEGAGVTTGGSEAKYASSEAESAPEASPWAVTLVAVVCGSTTADMATMVEESNLSGRAGRSAMGRRKRSGGAKEAMMRTKRRMTMPRAIATSVV